MTKVSKLLYNKFLSDETQKASERVILKIAIASFLIHLSIIFLVDSGLIKMENPSDFFQNPIAAIYTPFSFILIYEVYLLIYYIPKSFTTYISKQYEIIVLIIIRRLFKDLSSLSLSPNWFKIKYDLQFTYDLVASVLLFFLIFLFYKQSKLRFSNEDINTYQSENILSFIKVKKLLATILVPVVFVLAIYSLINWLFQTYNSTNNAEIAFSNINSVFFEQFFTILIIVDVILLLFSFFHTDQFHKVIRNSGFIISTILIRISFSVSGLLNTVLITSAIIFGLLILFIYNKFEKQLALEKNLFNN